MDARNFPQLYPRYHQGGLKIEDFVPQASCDCEQPINSVVRNCTYTSVWGCFLLLFALEQ